MYYYIKKFDTKDAKDNAILQKFLHKANILFKDLKHKNIIKYYGLIEQNIQNNNNQNETNYYLIYEYVDNDSLSKLLKNKNDSNILLIPEYFIIKIMKQVLSGLKYLHHQNLAHVNIQPSILYFDKNYNIKIGGLDLLGLYEDDIFKKDIINDDILFINDHYEYFGKYCSPEMLRGEEWNNKADIFGLGLVIISLMSSGDPIILSKDQNNKIKRDIDLTKIKYNYNKDLINLIRKMINDDPKERPTSKESYEKLLAIEKNIKKSKNENNNFSNNVYAFNNNFYRNQINYNTNINNFNENYNYNYNNNFYNR